MKSPPRGLGRLRIFRRNMGPWTIYLPTDRWKPHLPPDVILLQGFATGPRAMTPLCRALEARGLVCAVPRLRRRSGYLQLGTVRFAGRELASFLHSLPEGTRPWIIGHSIGGVIARQAIQLEGAASRVRGLITMGSPHRGTPAAIAGLAIGLGILSPTPFNMVPLAPTILRMNRAPWPSDIPLLSIVSWSDLLCPPPFGSLPFADGERIRTHSVSGHGHTDLLRSSEVESVIAETIESYKP